MTDFERHAQSAEDDLARAHEKRRSQKSRQFYLSRAQAHATLALAHATQNANDILAVKP